MKFMKREKNKLTGAYIASRKPSYIRSIVLRVSLTRTQMHTGNNSLGLKRV